MAKKMNDANSLFEAVSKARELGYGQIFTTSYAGDNEYKKLVFKNEDYAVLGCEAYDYAEVLPIDHYDVKELMEKEN